jgi:hypothetical protein
MATVVSVAVRNALTAPPMQNPVSIATAAALITAGLRR